MSRPREVNTAVLAKSCEQHSALAIVGTAFFGFAVFGRLPQFPLGLVIEFLVFALGLSIFLPNLVGTPDNIHHFWTVGHRPFAFECKMT